MIKRDGNRTSLWQNAAQGFQPSRQPAPGTCYDVIIAGGGITGITTALLLQQSGKKCIVLEAAGLCFGTTGGTTAHLNTLLDTSYAAISKNFNKEVARQVAAITGMAIDLVKEHVDRFNIDCGFSMADAYIFSQDEKEARELEEIFSASAEAGLQVSMEERLEIPVSFMTAMKAAGQAKFNPVAYVLALAVEFEKAGGTIVQECRVDGVEENEPLEVHTSRGIFHGRDMIYATHIPAGINLLHLRCTPMRSYALAARLGSGSYPENLYYDMKDPYNYYRTQEVNGENYFIAGGFDHKTGHLENTEKCFRELEAHVRTNFDVGDIPYQWSSQFFEPVDGLPYIGHLPGHPRHVYVATGFGGNGITYSHVAALILRNLLTNVESEYNLLFNPNRIKPVAGFRSFISHNADVVKQFFGKWFAYDKLEELAGIAPGEGRLVVFNDQKIAVFKDEDGSLHAINPACTHMKCSVAWNNGERSWDCPCHGARYSCDGQVLNGPAVKDLELIEVRSLVEKDA